MADERQPNGLGKRETKEVGEENERPLVIDVRESTAVADFVHADTNLETIGYFDAGYKRRYPRTPNEAKEVPLAADRIIRFVPSSYGYPNTEDQDFYRGLLKICEEAADCSRAFDEKGKPRFLCQLPQPLRFSTRRLIHASGRGENADERKAVRHFLRRNKATSIFGKLRVRRPDGKVFHAEVGDEPWFRKVVLVGDSADDGSKASENLVWFANWFVANYQTRYLKLTDNAFHQRLATPISKTLAPILSNGWFASRGHAWKKLYPDLTTILGIPSQRYLSRIQHQLDPSHRELQREQYLANWVYDKTDEGIYVITWEPGTRWFEEQEEYRKRHQTITAAYNNHIVRPTAPVPKPGSGGVSPASENTRGMHRFGDLVSERIAEMRRQLAASENHPSSPSQPKGLSDNTPDGPIALTDLPIA